MSLGDPRLPARAQDYFRAVAAKLYEAEEVPPFTAFFNPRNPHPGFNYAIPDSPASGGRDGPGGPRGDLSVPLSRLRERFRSRGRTPRFEFVEACAPDLAASLLSAGFVEEMRAFLMAVRRGEEKPVAAVEGLEVRRLGRDASLGDVKAAAVVARTVFGMGEAPPSDEEAFASRESIGDGATFLGLLDGRPVCCATLLPAADGIAEVAGVATLESFRRRGIGAALVAEALRMAFGNGLEAVVLSAGSPEAGRVYEAAGFRGIGATLMYVEAAEASGA